MNLRDELQAIKCKADADYAIESEILEKQKADKSREIVHYWMERTGISRMRVAANNRNDHYWLNFDEIKMRIFLR